MGAIKGPPKDGGPTQKGGVYYQRKSNLEEVMNPDHEGHFQKIVSRAKSKM